MVGGPRLEGVRRRTLADRLASAGESAELEGSDVDSDAEALAAYNRMLKRLNEPTEPVRDEETSSGR